MLKILNNPLQYSYSQHLQALLYWLSNNGLKYKSTSTYIRFLCPFHQESNPSFFVITNPLSPIYGLCKCFGCGWRGSITTLVKALKISPLDTGHYNDYNLCRDDKRGKLLMRPIRYSEEALAYLAKRGVDKALDAIPIYWCIQGDLAKRIVFKTYPNGFIGRSIDNIEPRYLIYGKALYTLTKGVDNARYVILTEGVFDALKAYLAGYPAIALLGKSVTRKKVSALNNIIKPNTTYIIAFDDDAYVEAISLLGQLLLAYPNSKFINIRLPSGYHDLGEMNPIEIQQILKGVVNDN